MVIKPTQLQKDIAAWLGDLTTGKNAFNVKDNRGAVLDSLNPLVFRDGSFLAIHHSLDAGSFRLNLAESDDGFTWNHVRELANHGSQGELYAATDGSWWLAFEADAPDSVHIRLQRYRTLAALRKGEPLLDELLPRSLAPSAEGTPSFESTNGDSAKLRLHYYRDRDVDRAASGEFRGRGRWDAKVDERWNQGLEALGIKGNIGGRTKIRLAGKDWYIQEGQLAKNDWASWRLWLIDSKSLAPISIPVRTPGGSRSFANPHAVRIGTSREELLLTLFMPTEGNAPLEKGEAISQRRIPAQWR